MLDGRLSMKNYKWILFILISVTACSQQQTVSDFFELYKLHQRQIASCRSVEDYKQFLLENGSRKSIQNLARSTEVHLNDIFKLEKHSAEDSVAHFDTKYVEGHEINDRPAKIVIKDKRYPGLTSTYYFVKEDDVWKVGKE